MWMHKSKYGVLELKKMYKGFIFGFVLSFLFFSCESIPPRGSLAGATVIGGNSDVFIFVPVQHNKTLLTKILPKHKYVKKALDRTDFLYLSVSIKGLEQTEILNKPVEEDNTFENEIILGKKEEAQEKLGKTPHIDEVLEENVEKKLFDSVSYDLCAVGTYPTKITRFFLTKKNGWTRKKEDGGYTYYQKENDEPKSFSSFSIPTKEIALFSYNSNDEYKIEDVLERVNKPRPAYFDEEFEMSIQQGNPSNDICIFVANSHFFLSKLLGINLDLPIESLKVYLTKDTSRSKEIYTYSIIIEAKNLTASFATRLLLSKLLKTQVRVNGNNIVVEKAKITSEKLVDIIQKVVGNL